MFSDCTSLNHAPELPVINLTKNCYCYMFRHCISLTQAPLLPATILAEYCYYQMFNGCTNLSGINVNFSEWSPTNATTNWLNNTNTLGTFTCPVDLPETRGTSYIPSGWTIVRK